ncbi:MAG TPA: nuclear transport factor 2 family protein [Fimbriimonas sp.]|nr:nuclear transport factor 2 family protein [Fimbriimonas sp.]
MRKPLAALCLALLTAVSFGGQSPRKTFEKLTADFVKAMKQKDISWFKKTTTPDFVAVDVHGKKMKRDEALEMLQEMMTASTFKSVTATVGSVSVSGKTAKIKTTTVITGSFKNPRKQGKLSKLKDTSTDEETWVKTPAGWKIQYDKTVKEVALIDGKVFTGQP